MGEGPKFEPDRTAPAGSVVTHHAHSLHDDGAKDQPALIEIVGMGPAATLPPEKCGR